MKKIILIPLLLLLLAGCDLRNNPEKRITGLIPASAMLREIELIPDATPTSYLGLYIENPKDADISSNDYSSCPEETKGQAINGTYHLFLYQQNKIVNDIKIPAAYPDEFNDQYYQGFPLKNTKINNYRFFKGIEPIKSDESKIEKTKLIHLGDYTGKRDRNDFLLVGNQSPCGHVEYLVAGYDRNANRAIIYPIQSGTGIGYWFDNFTPNDSGSVVVSNFCGDHGSEIETHKFFSFDSEKQAYVLWRDDKNNCYGAQ